MISALCRSLLLIMVLISITPVIARADLYKYVDPKGSVVITDKYDSIPVKYRKNVVTIKDTKEKNTAVPQSDLSAAVAQSASVDSAVQGRWQDKYLPLIITAVALVAVFIVIRKMAAGLGAGRIGLAVFLIIVLGACIYLYRLYMQDLSSIYLSLRQDTLNIKKNVESRDTKTDKALQNLEPGSVGR